MTIPRLDGWWDEINRGGAAEKFVGALDKRLRPDAYAQQALQEMIRQNPNALEQIANMDPGQRQMFAATMGFTKGNPFENLAPGAARTRLNEEQAAIAALTPEQQLARQAAVANVPTTEAIVNARSDRDLERKMKEFTFNNLVEDRPLAKLLNEEKSRVINTLNQMRTKYPELDVSGVVGGLLRGDLSPELLQQAQLLQNDYGAAFDTMLDMAKLQLQGDMQLRLRGMTDQSDFVRLAASLTESARKSYADATRNFNNYVKTNKLAGLSLEKAIERDPEFAKNVANYEAQMQQAKATYDSYAPVVARLMNVELPSIEFGADVPAASTTPLSPAAQEAVRRIKSGKATLGDIERSRFSEQDKQAIREALRGSP